MPDSVTSLEDDVKNPKPGTFRWAANQPGPRTILFRTGGTIELKDWVRIDEPNVTIAGHTAPGDGINFRHAPIQIRTHEVVVRGIRVRPGNDLTIGAPAQGRDALQINHDAKHRRRQFHEHGHRSRRLGCGSWNRWRHGLGAHALGRRVQLPCGRRAA